MRPYALFCGSFRKARDVEDAVTYKFYCYLRTDKGSPYRLITAFKSVTAQHLEAFLCKSLLYGFDMLIVSRFEDYSQVAAVYR